MRWEGIKRGELALAEDCHCVFRDGGYHVIDTSSPLIQDCDLDTASQLTNYVAEMKMAIVRSDDHIFSAAEPGLYADV
jgi:hypothetical protein